MSIRAGQILHLGGVDGGNFVIDRIQQGGVSNVNVPSEKIRETGNFQSVGVIRDIPDLTFEVQSLDVSTDIEALITNVTPSSITAGPGGTQIDFNNSQPLDIMSPFKATNTSYSAVRGVLVPYLTLENVTYRYGLRANAEETFAFRGDAIYYCAGSPLIETFAGPATTYSFAHGPAVQYVEQGQNIYAYGVSYYDSATQTTTRLFHTIDYTDTSSGITLLVAPPSTATVRVAYAASTYSPTYPQSLNTPATVKPAALRSKDIDVYIGTTAATPVFSRFNDVQSVEVTRKVTLQQDQEFGNAHYISQDYDTADVTGTVGIKPQTPIDFINKVTQLAGVATGQSSGPLVSPQLPMEIRLSDPNTGSRLKTIYVPDAIFYAAPTTIRQNTKFESSVRWESQQGLVYVYKGAR